MNGQASNSHLQEIEPLATVTDVWFTFPVLAECSARDKSMWKSLTILSRGLLLVSIPLLAQACFVGLLVQAQAEDAAAQRWAMHTKEVIAKVEEAYRRLLESYAAMRNRIVAGETPAVLLSVHAADPVRDQIGEIAMLVADNPEQQSRVNELAETAHAFLDVLSRQRQLIEHGKEREAYVELDEGGRILGQIRGGIDQIMTTENQLDQERMARLARLMRRQFWIALGGGLAILGATLVLALFFFHGVIKRLSVLSDNTRRLAAGEALHPLLTGADEIAQVDRAFHEMADSLDEKKQENEMFVYSVSHDLRSPLINLQGFSEELKLCCKEVRVLLEEDGIPLAVKVRGRSLLAENFDESIRYIHAAVGRMARIIDSLLRMSRAGRVQYQWQVVDVAAAVAKIVDALHDAIEDKGAEITVDELPPAWGDPTALEQVFANLIGNAVQYLDPRGPVKSKSEHGLRPPRKTLPAVTLISSRTTAWGSPRPITIGCSPRSTGFKPTWRKGKAIGPGPGAADRGAARRHDLDGVGRRGRHHLLRGLTPGGSPGSADQSRGHGAPPPETFEETQSQWEPNRS